MQFRTIVKTLIGLIALAALVIVTLNLIPERREVRKAIPHEFAVSDPQFLRTMNSVFGT